MKPNVDQLLEQAMKLPSEARAALAGYLLESLEQPTDENVEAEWELEIRRRLKELDSGEVEAVPWPEARRKILGK